MTDRYVRSTDGNDADDGLSWANAKATLAGAAAGDSPGDRIFLSQSHSESSGSAQTVALAGTRVSPVLVLCGNDAAAPPTALATTAVVATTGSNGIVVTGHAYLYGIAFTTGDSTGTGTLELCDAGGDHQIFESCDLILRGSSGSARLRLNDGTNGRLELLNSRLSFASTGQICVIGGAVNIRGGGIISGSSSPTTMFQFGAGANYPILIDGFDFSNLGSSFNILNPGSAGGRFVLRNCKLPDSWSGNLVSATPTGEIRVELWNCDSADTNYRLWIETAYGNIKSETTLVKTGGASDGDMPLSWKMVSGADAEYPLDILRSPEIFSERITSVGGSKTITVDILHDSATALKDDEIWLEVQYLGTSGRPLGAFANDAKAGVLTTGANQASSSATWTTTGMSNPNAQKLEVTFTPQEKGVAIVTVCMAKAGTYTVYVDPVAQVT